MESKNPNEQPAKNPAGNYANVGMLQKLAKMGFKLPNFDDMIPSARDFNNFPKGSGSSFKQNRRKQLKARSRQKAKLGKRCLR